MKFLLVGPEQIDGDLVILNPHQLHRLTDVLRLRPGDRVPVIVAGDMHGASRRCAQSLDTTLPAASPRLARAREPAEGGRAGSRDGTPWVNIRPGSAGRGPGGPAPPPVLCIDRSATLPGPPTPSLSLVMSLLKDDKPDDIVRQATELGVARLTFVNAARSIPRWKGASSRLRRLSEIVRSACEQSGNPYPPLVELFGSVFDFLKTRPATDGGLIAGVASGGTGFSGVSIESADVTLLVGPEGDWAPEETEAIVGAGGRLVTLGGNVLRSETACVVLAALLLGRMGRL